MYEALSLSFFSHLTSPLAALQLRRTSRKGSVELGKEERPELIIRQLKHLRPLPVRQRNHGLPHTLQMRLPQLAAPYFEAARAC